MRALVGPASAVVLLRRPAPAATDAAGPYGAQTARRSVSRWRCSAGTSRCPTCASTATTSSSTSTRRRRRPAARTPSPRPSGSVSTARWPTRSRPTRSAAARDVTDLDLQPAAAPTPDKLTGTVCLGPLRDQTPGARRVRLLAAGPDRRAPPSPTRRRSRSGCRRPTRTTPAWSLKTTSVDAFRADGAQLDPDRARRPDGVQRQRLHAARTRDQRSGSAIPRRLGRARRPADGAWWRRRCPARGCRTPARSTASSLLVLPDASLDAVVGAGVAVHAGRDQRRAAVRDGVGDRHARRAVDQRSD